MMPILPNGAFDDAAHRRPLACKVLSEFGHSTTKAALRTTSHQLPGRLLLEDTIRAIAC